MSGKVALVEAFSRLEEAFSEGAGSRKLLELVFLLNVEVGRLARNSPSLMPALKELQSFINGVTVNVKAGDRRGAAQWLERSRRSIEALTPED